MEPPQTPSTEDDKDLEEKDIKELIKNAPAIEPICYHYKGRAYVLEVGQQPYRARMCGFGDKVNQTICLIPKI
jgi:hypothetical protein